MATKLSYSHSIIGMSPNEFDSIVSMFERKGLTSHDAISCATIIINQAKQENVSALELVQHMNSVNIDFLYTMIDTLLNQHNGKTSTVGKIRRNVSDSEIATRF